MQKKGQFSGGRMGYFVKWRGYEEEHNSWVDEQDAGNAQELIDLFWVEKRKNKPGPRKSEPIKTKSKIVDKPSRKSAGGPRKTSLSLDNVEGRDEDEDDQRAKKKARKSNGHLRRDEKVESDEEEPLGDMKKHMKVPSWEALIDTIDTVEREGEELYVYFTLRADKKRVRENSRLCAEKFPQKLIMFYESNLRWKTEEANDPAEEVA
ncbi:hypothetical protein JVU11DRAFT_9933 [Chiua virens]|nr:hypothetical protein JVU11DRAFT_9933 [Chiua virens]